MLDLVFALLLAGTDLNDPGLGSPGLDDRTPLRPAVQMADGSRPGRRDAGTSYRASRAVANGEWDSVDVVITEAERRIFRDYFDRHPCALHDCGRSNNLPPGLAKKRSLPPGLARQLVRNGTLPPGLAGRTLPHDLARALPARPSSFRFVLVDDRVLLVERASDLILDTLEIVIHAGSG